MGFRDCWIEAGRPLPRETSKFNTRLGSILNSRASKIIIISQGKENILYEIWIRFESTKSSSIWILFTSLLHITKY